MEHIEQQTILHLSGRKNTKFENTSPTEFEHNTSTQLRETFVQFRSLFLHPSGHEFIGNGLQQFGFLSIGPHEVCFSGWSRLVLELNPNPFLYGFLLFLIIFLHIFQEAISTRGLHNMFNTYINSIGKNLAINLFVYNTSFAIENLCGGHSLFEQGSFPWCLQHHLSCRFAWLWPKEWLPSSKRYTKRCLASFPLDWSFWSILEAESLHIFSCAYLAPLPLWWNISSCLLHIPNWNFFYCWVLKILYIF